MEINNFALIIGSMKSGTTSLFNYLAQHPEISGCQRKEPNFFSYDDRWNQGFSWYLQEWPDWNPKVHKIALEATINYTKYPIYPNAAERIYQLRNKADFKFIYVVRNPLERIESQYTYELGSNRADKIKRFSDGDLEIETEFIETSKYAKQIKEYYKYFPKENILLLDFEDFKCDNAGTLKKIIRFLGVSDEYEFQDLNVIHNQTKSRVIDDKLWRSFRQIKPLRRVVNQTVPKKTKQAIHSLFGKKVTGNFKLSPQQRELVLRELEEDLLELKTKYNFDLSSWKIYL
ncbi:MAG: sulfotransferase family protein [Waterburya sp.]